MCLSDAICSWNSVGTFKYDNPWGFRARPTYSLKHVVSHYLHTPDHDYRNGKRQVIFVTNAQKLKLCVPYEFPACVKCLGNRWWKLPSCDITALWTPISIHSKNIKYKLWQKSRVKTSARPGTAAVFHFHSKTLWPFSHECRCNLWYHCLMRTIPDLLYRFTTWIQSMCLQTFPDLCATQWQLV